MKRIIAVILVVLLGLQSAGAMMEGDVEMPNEGDRRSTALVPYDQNIRHIHANILIVGERNVGKSSIMMRIYRGLLSERGFECISENQRYVRPDQRVARIPLSKHNLDWQVRNMKLQLPRPKEASVIYNPPRDLVRQQNYRYHFHLREANVDDPNIDLLYRQASVIFAVYDINDRNFTVEKATSWYHQIRRAARELNTHYVSSYIHFVGNKFDIFEESYGGNCYDVDGRALFPEHLIFTEVRALVEGSGGPGSCITGDFGWLDTILTSWGYAHCRPDHMAGWRVDDAENFQLRDHRDVIPGRTKFACTLL